MTRLKTAFLAATLPALMLAACGTADEAANDSVETSADPALGEELMYDLDLANSNGANGTVDAGGDGTLPEQLRSPEAMQRARSKALNLLGGPGKLKHAPLAQEVAGELPRSATLTAAALAAAAPNGDGNCADKADYTMAWADKLPEAFPVYPDGAVQQAAGTDEGACSLRVVSFLTPLPVSEIIDFYYSRAVNAGFSAQHVIQGGDTMIGGLKGKASFVVYARQLDSGVTEIDLVTSGG